VIQQSDILEAINVPEINHRSSPKNPHFDAEGHTKLILVVYRGQKVTIFVTPCENHTHSAYKTLANGSRQPYWRAVHFIGTRKSLADTLFCVGTASIAKPNQEQ
jgi:hypothetical protein